MDRTGEDPAGVPARIVVDPLGRVSLKNAARALDKSPKTLRRWKRLNIGPPAFVVTGRIYYYWSDVQAFGAGVQ